MKLNRKLVLILALVLSVAMATGGTLAFLTDRDTVENTFTMGNVDIEVEEEYEQDSPLLPGVEVEKKAGVKNVHKSSEAWVWMTVSVPEGLAGHITPNWLEGYEGTLLEGVTIHEGYVSYVVKHPYKLLPGTSTPAFLQGVTLTDKVDFQDGKYVVVENGEIVGEMANVDDLKVIVDGFAIQTDGFTTVDEAYEAYTTQWGGLSAGGESGANGGDVEGEPTVIHVSTVDELVTALETSSTIIFDAEISADNHTIPEGGEFTIELDDKTLSGTIYNNGTMEINGGTIQSNAVGLKSTGDATLKDIVMNAGNEGNYSNIISAGAEVTYENVDIVSAGGGIGADGGAQVVFNGGSVYVDSASTSGRYNFYVVDDGTVVTIEDGTFSFSPTKNQKRAYIYAGSGATVYVNGGTFGPASTRDGYTAGILGDGSIIITGGTFGFNPSSWVAEGYEAVNNGSTWTVTAK
ncbi:MAG: hypothetical protein E7319_03470 [Clostridiales bacterium]|nr:hypothetical protein [Clostridiales bacterium]